MFPLPTGTPSHPEQQVLNPHQLYHNISKKSHKEDNLETHQYYEALKHFRGKKSLSSIFYHKHYLRDTYKDRTTHI